MALMLVGTCLGLKSKPAKEAGKPPTITAGVSFPVNNGFDGQNEVIEVRFFPKQIEQGMHHGFQTMRGVQVQVPVSINARAFNGSVYVDYNCEGLVAEVKPEAPKKAANA